MTEVLHTELGFGYHYGDPWTVWSDFSAYLMSGSANLGRNDELDTIETGEASFTFDNVSGVLTPGRTALLEPGNPIRSYLIADDNWIHVDAVNANSANPNVPRFVPTAANSTTTVSFSALYGRETWLLSRAASSGGWIAGLAEDNQVFVKAGQVVRCAGLFTPVDVGGPTVNVDVRVSYAPIPAAGTLPAYTDVAISSTASTIGTVTPLTATWTATADGYVRMKIAVIAASGSLTTGRAADLKLTIDNATTAVNGVSGYIPVFRGFVDKWTQEYTGTLSTVTAECTDGLALIGKPLSTYYRSAVRRYAATLAGNTVARLWYWPCVEAENVQSTDPLIGDLPLKVVTGTLTDPNSFAFTNTPVMPHADGSSSGGWTSHIDPGLAYPFPGSILSLAESYTPVIPGSTFNDQSVCMSFWFLPETLPPAGTTYTLWQGATSTDAPTDRTAILVNPDGHIDFLWSYGTLAFSTAAGVVKAGIPIHVGMSVALNIAGGTIALNAYVNGVQVGTSSNFGGSIPQFGWSRFGGDTGSASSRTPREPIRGTMAHIILGYNAGTFAQSAYTWGSEATSTEVARIGDILDFAGWTGPRSLDSSKSTLIPPRWDLDADGGQLLADAADSAGGVAYVGTAGEVVYHNRGRRVNPVIRYTVAEWSDGLRFTLDLARVYNEVQAERATGMIRTARDDTSIGRIGRRTLKVTRDVSDPAEMADAAAWLLRRYRQARPQSDTLTIDAHTLTGPTDAPLKRLAYSGTLDDRFQLTGLPSDAPAATCDFFIEGRTVSFAVENGLLEWSTSFNVSDVGDSFAWVLEDASTGSLDSITCVLSY